MLAIPSLSVKPIERSVYKLPTANPENNTCIIFQCPLPATAASASTCDLFRRIRDMAEISPAYQLPIAYEIDTAAERDAPSLDERHRPGEALEPGHALVGYEHRESQSEQVTQR